MIFLLLTYDKKYLFDAYFASIFWLISQELFQISFVFVLLEVQWIFAIKQVFEYFLCSNIPIKFVLFLAATWNRKK